MECDYGRMPIPFETYQKGVKEFNRWQNFVKPMICEFCELPIKGEGMICIEPMYKKSVLFHSWCGTLIGWEERKCP